MNSDLRDLQRLLDETYGEHDRRLGAAYMATVLVEEVGELAGALARGREADAKDELADVLFVAVALANVLGVDATAALRGKAERSPHDVSRNWERGAEL